MPSYLRSKRWTQSGWRMRDESDQSTPVIAAITAGRCAMCAMHLHAHMRRGHCFFCGAGFLGPAAAVAASCRDSTASRTCSCVTVACNLTNCVSITS